MTDGNSAENEGSKIAQRKYVYRDNKGFKKSYEICIHASVAMQHLVSFPVAVNDDGASIVTNLWADDSVLALEAAMSHMRRLIYRLHEFYVVEATDQSGALN